MCTLCCMYVIDVIYIFYNHIDVGGDSGNSGDGLPTISVGIIMINNNKKQNKNKSKQLYRILIKHTI